MQFHVDIARDPVSRVWITRESDVPGLAMYDESPEGLLKRFPRVIPYLLRVNKVETGMEQQLDLEISIEGERKELQSISLVNDAPNFRWVTPEQYGVVETTDAPQPVRRPRALEQEG
jgi:Domain of unknown function (DUF1902)